MQPIQGEKAGRLLREVVVLLFVKFRSLTFPFTPRKANYLTKFTSSCVNWEVRSLTCNDVMT